MILNNNKTKDIFIGFRKQHILQQFSGRGEVERVSGFKYLGVHLAQGLTRRLDTAEQRLCLLRTLRPPPWNSSYNTYRCTTENLLTCGPHCAVLQWHH